MNNKISTFDNIIINSINLFHQNTFAKTTLQDICKNSEVSTGSIYHAFPRGKEDIVIAICQKYNVENDKILGEILKNNAVSSTISDIIDSLIKALLELGQKYPCFYDQGFLIESDKVCKNLETDRNEVLDYTTILFQIKYPNLTKKEAELKAKICNNIWSSLIQEYDTTQDKQILEQLKVVTLKYLEN
jgi:AcrR family transcriptional regulator